jgi:probable phosphoglycerate mutase
MPERIFFIRHGETEWSLSGRHTGLTDIPLTEAGKNEARDLGKRFSAWKFDHVFTSPRQRAQQTCHLTGLTTPAEIDPDLSEWDYGDYEGRGSADIRKERPGWNIFQDGCPGGELPTTVSERADRLIARLRTLRGTIILFSHGQFGCVFAARWIGSPAITGQHFQLGTATISILGYDPNHPEIPVIALWNGSRQLPESV